MIGKAVLSHGVLLLGAGVSSAALAANPAWVTATGTDTGLCPVTAPCATVQYAINKTNVGGTVYITTSGMYKSFTVSKSVSVIAPAGVQATVYQAPSEQRSGIEVNAPSGSIVILKGLSVIGHNADTGYFPDIQVDSGRVTIEDCILTTGNWGIYTTNPDFVMIKNNHIEGTARGIENHNNVSNIYISKNTITLNDYALVGAFYTFSDNAMNGNALCDTCGSTLHPTTYDQ